MLENIVCIEIISNGKEYYSKFANHEKKYTFEDVKIKNDRVFLYYADDFFKNNKRLWLDIPYSNCIISYL